MILPKNASHLLDTPTVVLIVLWTGDWTLVVPRLKIATDINAGIHYPARHNDLEELTDASEPGQGNELSHIRGYYKTRSNLACISMPI